MYICLTQLFSREKIHIMYQIKTRNSVARPIIGITSIHMVSILHILQIIQFMYNSYNLNFDNDCYLISD